MKTENKWVLFLGIIFLILLIAFLIIRREVWGVGVKINQVQQGSLAEEVVLGSKPEPVTGIAGNVVIDEIGQKRTNQQGQVVRHVKFHVQPRL